MTRYARPMPIVSKTVEVAAPAAAIMAIVADFEAYPQWNEEVTGAWILARYDDGRPSQLRLDTKIQGMEGSYIQAVYYPADGQIQTVMQQGNLFSKQEQLFAETAIDADEMATTLRVLGMLHELPAGHPDIQRVKRATGTMYKRVRKARRNEAQSSVVDIDETDTAESFELPGADLSGEELSVRVVPKQADEFTCSSCFLVHHRSRLARMDGNLPVCQDCA